MTQIRRLATTVSLVFLFLFALLWLRGLVAKDTVSWNYDGGIIFVASYPHHLVIIQDPLTRIPGLAKVFGQEQIPARFQYLEFHARYVSGVCTVWLPHWLSMLFFSAMPMDAAMGQWRGKRRQRRGLCTQCGYDLRASTDRCPECGAIIGSIGVESEPLRSDSPC